MNDALVTVDKQRLEDARRVLRVLTAAFPSHPFGDDSVELYLAVIVKDMPDFSIAMRVATDWATTQMFFPKVVELTDAYLRETEKQARRARQAAVAQQHTKPGTFACPRCEDSGFEVLKVMNLDVLYEAIAPCSRCRPEERDYWREGHTFPEHDIENCEHPRCQQRAAGSKRRRGER